MLKKANELIKKYLFLIVLIIIPILVGLPLLKSGYFSMHDDVQVMRLYEMEKCFKDGQIPCRWVPDMGAGYGHPLFNYHPVFVYYLGMFFRILNLTFIDTSKLLFFFSLVFSSLFMYLLAKDFFGKTAGIVAASMFLLAPYHAVDIYVRGALTESWGIALFPLILWAIYRFINTEKSIYFVLTIISVFFLLITHNTMPFLFMPVAFLWALFWILIFRKYSIILKLIISFVWALGLSSFFLLPSILEIKLAKLETMASGYYNYRDHFVSFFQLFLDRSWGYGSSRLGIEDGMSFQLGWPFWLLSVLCVLITLYAFVVKKNKEKNIYLLIFFSVLFLGSIFMTHAKSYFLWQLIPGMGFVQFPWRFLSLSILAMSILVAGLLGKIDDKNKKIFLSLSLIIITLFLNVNYFKPVGYNPEMTDEKKLSGEEWKKQSMATLNDYVPVAANQYPEELVPNEPWVVEGKAKITEFKKRSNYFRFAVGTVDNNAVLVEIPVFDFPIWEVYLNTEKTQYSHNPETGVIQVMVPAGNHTVVTGWLRDTLFRKIANWLSMFSLFALMVLILAKGKNERI